MDLESVYVISAAVRGAEKPHEILSNFQVDKYVAPYSPILFQNMSLTRRLEIGFGNLFAPLRVFDATALLPFSI
jgi:hypothetical protein